MTAQPSDADECHCPSQPRTVGTPGASALAKFGEELITDPSWLFEDHPSAGSWSAGGLGEMMTAKVLEQLGPDWYITHDFRIGGASANLDHVVVGPPGVFVLNSKYHGSKPVTVGGDVVLVGSRSVKHVPAGAWEAADASRRLTRAYDAPVLAVSLIVVIADRFRVSAHPNVPTVRVAHISRLVDFLERLPSVLDPCTARCLVACVREPATWA